MIEEEFKKLGLAIKELGQALFDLFKIEEMAEWLTKILNKSKGE